ncbi:hypothetical protein MMC22_000884 [Lobaria immixta]|nr:hypothetical protein [Lobaria immixta]
MRERERPEHLLDLGGEFVHLVFQLVDPFRQLPSLRIPTQPLHQLHDRRMKKTTVLEAGSKPKMRSPAEEEQVNPMAGEPAGWERGEKGVETVV